VGVDPVITGVGPLFVIRRLEGSSTIQVASTATSATFESLITLATSGTGDSVIKSSTVPNLQLKGLTAGAGISITPAADDLTIASTGWSLGGSGLDYAFTTASPSLVAGVPTVLGIVTEYVATARVSAGSMTSVSGVGAVWIPLFPVDRAEIMFTLHITNGIGGGARYGLVLEGRKISDGLWENVKPTGSDYGVFVPGSGRFSFTLMAAPNGLLAYDRFHWTIETTANATPDIELLWRWTPIG
jgi:hypothetical protein